MKPSSEQGGDTVAMGAERTSIARRLLDRGWLMCSTPAGACADPRDLESFDPEWLPAAVPGTAAGALRAASRFDWAGTGNLDDQDHWFRLTLPDAIDTAGRTVLVFGGIATVGEVWLDGERVLETDNMFLEHRIDLGERLGKQAAPPALLYVCCRSITPRLAERKPRARWRTGLVGHRNLRFLRTSLLGRMPGICPSVPVVGPWRGVWLQQEDAPGLEGVELVPVLLGNRGRVSVRGRLRLALDGVRDVSVAVELEGVETPLDVTAGDGGAEFSGTAEIDGPRLWWPHTHGTPHRYRTRLRISTGEATWYRELVPVGFRRIELDDRCGAFGLAVNGTGVFCRGACWTPVDFLGQASDAADLRRALERVVDAGMNMLRIPGNTVYERDAFYELCDELGVLVWQDFMFANMDYPFDDTAFRASAVAEVEQTLAAIGHRPCLAVLCGGSEVQQQAAMLGLPESTWRVAWFEQDLAQLSRARRPDAVYVAGSPSGGCLPFHLDEGPGHYFGVGGYRLPLADAWLNEPRFASECLAFGAPPEPGSADARETDAATLLDRTPRDAGADWSFLDVSEHYARDLYGIDPARLRDQAPARHLLACRAAAGEMMSRVQAIWRRPEAACRGALVWLLRDFWPGAGWGLLASDGTPKAAWFHLKRCWRPRTILFLDRGLNGLRVLAINDRAEPWSGVLTVCLERFDGVVAAQGSIELSVPARSVSEHPVEEAIGSFVDSGYAYRFGPPGFDVAHAQWRSGDETLVAVHVREGAFPEPVDAGRVRAALTATPTGGVELEIASEAFLHTVAVHAPGLEPADNYFHVTPGRPRRVTFSGAEGPVVPGCTIEAMNLACEAIEVDHRALAEQ